MLNRWLFFQGEGEDFTLLLRFVCLGVSLLPAVNFNLPLFFRLLQPQRTTSSPKKKKKRPMDGARTSACTSVPTEGKPGAGSTVQLADKASCGDVGKQRDGKFLTGAGVLAARALVPEEERTRLFSKRPRLFGVLLR